MSSSKHQKRATLFFWFAVLGMAYFNAFSSLEMDAGLRNGLAIVPILIGFGLVGTFKISLLKLRDRRLQKSDLH